MSQEWDAFVATHSRGHLLQTSEWGAFKSKFGWRDERVTMKESGSLTAGAQILYRDLPGRLLSIAYVPKGPVVDWSNPVQVEAVLQALRDAARRQRAIAIRIEPHLMEGEIGNLGTLLAQSGYYPVQRSVQPRRTTLLDIGGSEDEILQTMKQKTRYNIRLAGRKEVVVREGTAADVTLFTDLMQTTGRRNDFGVHSPEYYQAIYRQMAPAGRVGLLLAEYQNQPLAGLMVFCLGDTAWYFYGASSDAERNRMPTYLLQWEAIRWARARHCTIYDLWGVPDADEATLEAEFNQRSDGLWGVYRFKRGFGGRLVRWVGAFDCVLNRPLYALSRRLIQW